MSTLTLDEFFDILDTHERRVPIDELEALLARLTITDADVRDFVIFGDDCYQRNLMRTGRAYEALILCWKPGQRSPIHDHEGSSCGIRVLRGTLTETIFEHNERGWVYATRSAELDAGHVCGSADLDTHQISNLRTDDEPLVTMHIYSPPLGAIGLYSLENNTVKRLVSPVNRDEPLPISGDG